MGEGRSGQVVGSLDRCAPTGAGVVVVGSLRWRGGGKGGAAVAVRWSAPSADARSCTTRTVMNIEEFNIECRMVIASYQRLHIFAYECMVESFLVTQYCSDASLLVKVD